jgi:tellurite methyltransferase
LPEAARLTTLCGKFETVDWPPHDWPAVDLINASFALPLCPLSLFPGLWNKITAALASGAYFAGQLYGERDDWAGNPMMTILDEAGARRLLAAYVIERFAVEESDAVTPRGKNKHWHIFHIVARKR